MPPVCLDETVLRWCMEGGGNDGGGGEGGGDDGGGGSSGGGGFPSCGGGWRAMVEVVVVVVVFCTRRIFFGGVSVVATGPGYQKCFKSAYRMVGRGRSCHIPLGQQRVAPNGKRQWPCRLLVRQSGKATRITDHGKSLDFPVWI